MDSHNYRTIGFLVELCNFKSNMHESSYQSKKQIMAIMNWSSGERCGPWASCLTVFKSYKAKGG